MYVLFYIICVRTDFVDFREFVVWWLVCRLARRHMEVCFSPDIILFGWLGSKYQLTSCLKINSYFPLTVFCQVFCSSKSQERATHVKVHTDNQTQYTLGIHCYQDNCNSMLVLSIILHIVRHCYLLVPKIIMSKIMQRNLRVSIELFYRMLFWRLSHEADLLQLKSTFNCQYHTRTFVHTQLFSWREATPSLWPSPCMETVLLLSFCFPSFIFHLQLIFHLVPSNFDMILLLS